jgi:hypothetical protein
MGESMKDKATATLRLKASGEVVGEIVNEQGRVVSSKRFGLMTEDEFRKNLQHVEKVFSEASSDVIEPQDSRPPFWRTATT